ncbi:MAG: hypothetical protein M3Y08_17425, partial [Fibrobacterota bacterium]|nr:hypothetical protein [Fibrobacterota bacterium]
MFKSGFLCIALFSAYAHIHALPAFPGAEGWGAETPGGRGASPRTAPPKVYVVTTLASSGKGSFNEAFLTKGPRIIVFRVSGVIDLNPNSSAQNYLDSTNSYVTIAGQTSPGGVTFTSSKGGSSIMLCYHGKMTNGIFRFLRFRATAENEDGITMSKISNFIFDHTDFSGARDETLDLTATHHITLQWCTVANSSVGQTYGFLMGYPPTSQISIHHNLMAHHVYR